MKIFNKIIKNISIIQIFIMIFIFISMYLPLLHFKGGTIDSNFNTFWVLKGISETSGTVYTKFSFQALLPYLFMIEIIIINIFLDNKRNLFIHIIKALLFIVSAIMVFNFKHLLSYGEYFDSSLLKFIDYRIGRIITPIIMLIGFMLSIIEIIFDILHLKNVREI